MAKEMYTPQIKIVEFGVGDVVVCSSVPGANITGPAGTESGDGDGAFEGDD